VRTTRTSSAVEAEELLDLAGAALVLLAHRGVAAVDELGEVLQRHVDAGTAHGDDLRLVRA
jgi:hypothetical protein